MTRKLIAITFAACSISAGAATCTYTGDSGNWNDPDNWQDKAMPGAGDTAVIAGAADGKTITVTEPVSVARLETSGSGSVTLAGEKITLGSSGGSGRIEVGCALTVNDDIEFPAKGLIGCRGAHAVFGGDIVCLGTVLQIGGAKGADFNGIIAAPDATLKPMSESSYQWTYGVFNFNAAVTIAKFDSSNTYGIPSYYFNATGNAWGSYSVCLAKMYCGAENAMCGTGVLAFNNYYSHTTYDSYNSFDLNGWSQVANRIVSSAVPARDSHRIISTGNQPTTLTLKGTDNASTYASIRDAISIVWDPEGAFTQTFQDREHPTTGSLVVKGGTLRVAGTSKFANVPEVSVEAGATFDLDVTVAGALGSLTNLQIASGGKFLVGASATGAFNPGVAAVTMAEGAELQLAEDTMFLSLRIGEKEYAARSYEDGSIPGITGGAVTVLTGGGESTSTGVWIGEGASENTSDDDNWEGGHPARQGLTFASAGSRAVLNENLEATNVLFRTAQENPTFTIAADPAKPNAKLGIGAGIMVSDPQDGVARRFAVEPGVSLSADKVGLAVNGKANTLTLDGPIVSSLPKVEIARTGTGTLYLNATNSSFTGPVAFSSGTNYITGGALGSDNVNAAEFRPTAETFVSFQGGVDGRRYYFNRTDSAPVVRVRMPEGVTNRFNGTMVFNTNSGIPVLFESGSETTFAGGLTLNYYCYLIELTQQLGSTLYFVDNPIKGSSAPYGQSGMDEPSLQFVGKSVGSAGYAGDPLFVVATANNEVKQGLGLYGRARLRFDVDNAFGSTTPFYMMFDETGASGRMDLNGHDQTFGSFLSRPSRTTKRTHALTTSGWIGSDIPATLHVYQTVAETTADVGWRPPFTGAVSLCKDGAETLTLAGYSSTTGRLEVAAGLLRFSPTDLKSGWTNATEYVVRGGTLQIDSDSRIRRKAEWKLSAAGKLDVASGVQVVAKHLWLTDAQGVQTEAAPGVYTARNAPDYITGEGSLRCTGGGVILIVR